MGKKAQALILAGILVFNTFSANLSVMGAENPYEINYALNGEVQASEYYQDETYNLCPENGVDGDLDTRWASNNKCVSAWYDLTLKGGASKVSQLVIRESAENANNIKKIKLEYLNESDARIEVENLVVSQAGKVTTVRFQPVKASKFRITLETADPQPGLNIAEFELRLEKVATVTAQASNTNEAFPAGNLTDQNPKTRWESIDNNGAEITLDFQESQQLNTLVIDEYKETAGKIKDLTVEYWDGQVMKELKTADCRKLPFKKNIFFDAIETNRMRITLTTEEKGSFAINEIAIKNSSAEEMPEDKDLITLEPDVKPNAYQQAMVDNGYTMFVHFGLNTFTEDEWTDGSLPPSTYAPNQVDADQWVKVVKESGMKTILLVAKHHEGFSLWDSAYTDYDIGNADSGSHIDVIQAISDACNKYGINMGIYYSAWDRNWDMRNPPATSAPEDVAKNDAEYNQYMRNQITELLGGKYGLKDENGRGVISEVWIDGTWIKEAKRWGLDEFYDTVKKLQPSCQVGNNLTIGVGTAIHPSDQKEGDEIYYFPSDFRIHDGNETGEQDPKLFTYRGQTYYLPFEATLILNRSWFWHTGYGEVPSRDPKSIVNKYNKYKEEDNILVLNCGPNREGRIEQADIDSLYAAAKLLGIASGDALKKTLEEVINEYRGENLALNSVGTSEQTYTGASKEDYTEDKMFDGDSGTRWASRGNDLDSIMEITLSEERTFNSITIQEGAGFDRTDNITLEYQKGEEWISIFTEAAFSANRKMELKLADSITARKLRLTLHDKEMQGPTISEFSLYQTGELPQMEVQAERTELEVGETASMKVLETQNQLDLGSITTFRSEDENIASINSSGQIIAAAPGNVNMIAVVEIMGSKKEMKLPIKINKKGTAEIAAKKKELQEQIHKAENILKAGGSSYTETSWKTFEQALQSAKLIIESQNAKLTEVTSAILTLNTAMDKLIRKPEPPSKILVSEVKLNKTGIKLFMKDTIKLAASVFPGNADDQSVIWKSSNTSVVRVDNSGTVTPVKPGTAVVTVTARDGSNKSAQCKLTVIKPVVKLRATSVKLQIKKSTSAIKAYGLQSGDKIKSWSSNKPSVASVNSKGKITAKAKGTATITVQTMKGATASCKVNVTKTPVTTSKLTLGVKKLTLKKGKSYSLLVTRTPLTATDKITFTSSNKKFALVNSKGKITARKKGRVTITAKTGNGKSATVKVLIK